MLDYFGPSCPHFVRFVLLLFCDGRNWLYFCFENNGTWMYAKPRTVALSVSRRQCLISYFFRARTKNRITVLPEIAFHLKRYSRLRDWGQYFRHEKWASYAINRRKFPRTDVLIWFDCVVRQNVATVGEQKQRTLWVFQCCDLTPPMFWHISSLLIGLARINRFSLCFQKPIWHAEQ